MLKSTATLLTPIFVKDPVIAVLPADVGPPKRNAKQTIPKHKNSLRVKDIAWTADVVISADIFKPQCKKEAFQPPFQNSPKD